MVKNERNCPHRVFSYTDSITIIWDGVFEGRALYTGGTLGRSSGKAYVPCCRPTVDYG